MALVIAVSGELMRDIREKLSEYLMYFTLTIWFSSEVLLNSYIEKVLLWENEDLNSVIALLTTVLLVIQIVFFQHYEKLEIALLGIFSVVILIATLKSGYNIIMSTWLFIVASKHVKIESVVKLTYVILMITVSIIIIMYFGGWINERMMYRGGIIRHSWGFKHPNWLGVRIYQLILIHCYIRRRKINIFDYAIIAFGVWFIYKVPNCQTAYFSLLAFLIMVWLFEIGDRLVGGRDFLAKILIAGSGISNIGSVALSLINVKEYRILDSIDHTMSSRFSWCHKSIAYYGIKLLGQKIDLYANKFGVTIHRFYVDTAYVAILIRYGVIVYLIFSALYIGAMIYCYRQRNYMMVIILATYALYGIMENTFFSLTQNIFLIALSFPLYSIKLMYNDGIAEKPRVRYKFIF